MRSYVVLSIVASLLIGAGFAAGTIAQVDTAKDARGDDAYAVAANEYLAMCDAAEASLPAREVGRYSMCSVGDGKHIAVLDTREGFVLFLAPNDDTPLDFPRMVGVKITEQSLVKLSWIDSTSVARAAPKGDIVSATRVLLGQHAEASARAKR